MIKQFNMLGTKYKNYGSIIHLIYLDDLLIFDKKASFVFEVNYPPRTKPKNILHDKPITFSYIIAQK